MNVRLSDRRRPSLELSYGDRGHPGNTMQKLTIHPSGSYGW
ncbi:hypothetical protein ACQ4M4_28470 [Leptolyngbya sp. AN02str]